MHDKTVGEVMTKAEDVFMLSIDAKLDRELLKTMLKKGHSRIPVYVNEPGNVVALLLVKQLLLTNPDEGRTVIRTFSIYVARIGNLCCSDSVYFNKKEKVTQEEICISPLCLHVCTFGRSFGRVSTGQKPSCNCI